MTEEKKPAPQKGGQSSEQKGGGGEKRPNRRYYRQRGKKKGDPSSDAPASSATGAGSGPESKGGQGEAKSAGEESGNSSSRRRRSSRTDKPASKNQNQGQRQSQNKDRSSKKRQSNNRKRRNRRQPAEPMVETGIQVPETVGYVEPQAVYVYEHLIRPAYRDASDYRPDSFSRQFDHSEPGVSQLLGQYVGLYHPQYPMEEHPEDALYRREGAEPVLTPAQAIRVFFAENPEPDEDIPLEEIPEIYANPVVAPGPNADKDPDA